MAVKADVSKDREVGEMVKRIIQEWGRLDILVNNAGTTTFVAHKDLNGLTEDVWDQVFSVNVKGTFFCCRAVVPQMRQQGRGRIINLASVAGLAPAGSSIPYCCSKAAVVQMSKCLAKTLGPEIAVNVIAPGFIAETRWNVGRPNLEVVTAKATQAVPLKRVGGPDDIADAALYLATRGEFMTGDVMVVDGGRLLA
jgi:3-oxoacyl-[acyl-carrier protein] reductase